LIKRRLPGIIEWLTTSFCSRSSWSLRLMFVVMWCDMCSTTRTYAQISWSSKSFFVSKTRVSFFFMWQKLPPTRHTPTMSTSEHKDASFSLWYIIQNHNFILNNDEAKYLDPFPYILCID
jgi:hypothetical protein